MGKLMGKLFKICDCCKKKRFFMDMQIGDIICNGCANEIGDIRQYSEFALRYALKYKLYMETR